jgi:amino acid transporter
MTRESEGTTIRHYRHWPVSLGYLNARWWHGLENSQSLLTGQGLAVGVAAIFLFTALNLLGVRWMAEGNAVAMVWKIAVPVLTLILIMSYAFHASNFTAGGGFMPYGIEGSSSRCP